MKSIAKRASTGVSKSIGTGVADAFDLLNEIGIINQLSTARFEAQLPDGLTRAQFSVLNNFVRLGGTRTPAQLAAAFQVTRGAMTNTLSRLEAAGLVEIRPSNVDGRSKEVRITPKGRRLRERAIAATGPELSALIAALGKEELTAALPFLKRLRSHLDAHR